jgi:DNA-binding transcriptional ArsR family regulator
MELAAPFAMSQPAVSRHLKVLESAGLITRRVDGARRPCRLAPDAIAAVDQWLAMLKAALEANYTRLDALLADLESTPAKGKR